MFLPHRLPALACALLFMAGPLACSSSSSSSDSTAAFIGTWQYTTGTQTSTCGSKSTTTALSGQMVQLQQGTATGTIEYIGPNGCDFALSVSGDTLTAAPGATCTEMMNGITAMETITALTATLSGTTITENGAVSAVLNDNGVSEDCTASTTATLTQVSK
jgi:hypothetical protein